MVSRLNCIAVVCSTGVRRTRGCATGLAKAMRQRRGGAARCSGSLRATETGPIPRVVRWSTKRMRVLRVCEETVTRDPSSRPVCGPSLSGGWDVDLVLMPMLEGSDNAEGWVWSWDAKGEQAETVGGRKSDASKHARDGQCSHKQPCTDLRLDRISVQVSLTLRTYRSMFILKLISLATSVWALGCKYTCAVVHEYFENLGQNVLGRFCAKCV